MHKIFDLREMDVEQLRALAEDLNVKGYKKMEKEDLVYAVLDEEAKQNALKVPEKKEKPKRGRPRKEADAPKAEPKKEKTEENLIKGCQSRVWLSCKVEDGKLWFAADSDAIITKGIISLLIGIYSGRTSQEIMSSDFSVVEKIGLKENLSPTRANGLVSMIEKIREIAARNA